MKLTDPILQALLKLISYFTEDHEDTPAMKHDVLEDALLAAPKGFRSRTFGSNY